MPLLELLRFVLYFITTLYTKYNKITVGLIKITVILPHTETTAKLLTVTDLITLHTNRQNKQTGMHWQRF